MPTTQLHEATMSVDTVAARTDSAGGAVTPDWKAEERRMAYAFYTEGVLPDPLVAFQVVAGAGGTMNVIVGSGTAETDLALIAGQVAGQGKYFLRLDDVTKTIPLDAAGASSRRDNVYLLMNDNPYDTSSRALPRFAVRKGDAGGADPGPDANWEAFLLLSHVDIPASAPDIAACTITDDRVFISPVLNKVHAAEHATTGSDPVPIGSMIEFGFQSLESGVNLTSSFQSLATVTFTKPASWITYRIVALGDATAGEGTNSQPEARIQIGGNNGPFRYILTGGSVAGEHVPTGLIRHERTGLTANVSVILQLRDGAGSTGATSQWAFVEYMAVRTS